MDNNNKTTKYPASNSLRLATDLFLTYEGTLSSVRAEEGEKSIIYAPKRTFKVYLYVCIYTHIHTRTIDYSTSIHSYINPYLHR